MTTLALIHTITRRHQAAMAEALAQVNAGWQAPEVAAVWEDAMTVVQDLRVRLDEVTGPAFQPTCNGICLTASDIGLPGNEVAYPHPTCPAHGDAPDHEYEHDFTDGHGHDICRCGGVKSAHHGESPCTHPVVSSGRCFDCGEKPPFVLGGAHQIPTADTRVLDFTTALDGAYDRAITTLRSAS